MVQREREKELKKIAMHMVWLQDSFQDEKKYEWEKQEIKEELDVLRMKVVRGGHSVDNLLRYMEEYKELRVGEVSKWENGEW